MSGGDYLVDVEPSVRDEVASLPRELQIAVVKRMAELGRDPRPANHEKLRSDALRIRFSGCRITYLVDDANHWVTVTRVARDLPEGDDL